MYQFTTHTFVKRFTVACTMVVLSFTIFNQSARAGLDFDFNGLLPK